MAGATTTSASDWHLCIPFLCQRKPVDKVAISIHRRFEGLSPPSDCCIFTIPERLRQTNEGAYTPRVVAIGPYHRLNPSLMPMEDHKLLYLQNFLQHYQNYHLKDYIKRVMSWEDEVRNCYDKQINLDSEQFAEMILLDGIFVIQLFLMRVGCGWMLPNDQIFGKPRKLFEICQDLALLENQIPFFVIHRLFEMAFGMHPQHMPRLLELVCQFFNLVMREEKLPEGVMESEVKHLVHAISLLFWPQEGKQRPPNENHKEQKFPPPATELVASGVKLRRSKSKCLFNIEFKNGVLNIPYLFLNDTMELYFRNIIAFEQCHHINTDLTDYMVFMHHLVETPGDAELLIDKGIIKNWLRNNEAATRVINKFGEGIVLSRNYHFNSLSHELTNHCQRPYNKWKATFKRDYCSSPWVVISVIAAVLLLLLTVVQTVCSVLSLNNLPF